MGKFHHVVWPALLHKSFVDVRAGNNRSQWLGAIGDLLGSPYVTDIRNYGFAAGLSLEHYPGEPLRRPFELGLKCFEKGFYVRWGADTIQLAPPFTTSEAEIDSLINGVGEALHELD